MKAGKIIKVCGMSDAENIRRVEALGIDWMGFVFHQPSPRCIHQMPGYLPAHCKRIGVFVNEQKQHILTVADRFALDYVQLHGEESPEFCRSIQQAGLSVIKAFGIKTSDDVYRTNNYEGVCSFFLFDAPCRQYGGSGNQFDWDVLSHYSGTTPFILSGGINQYSAPALNKLKHPMLAGFDINSRFETSPGVKDVERITYFLNELK
ncbi:phosphoribosylanthranilate isomerase [Bacteroides sp. OttesenSCG-928-E20]|nr:phosphoribosylanthranilate isomerase [Bacteroides sp. OttesenSCG-928-E20]